MYSSLLLLVSLYSVCESAGVLQNAGFPHPLNPEEPPHVLVMDPSPGDLEGLTLSTKQKKVLYHPEMQKMIVDQLQRDVDAIESDRDERDVVNRESLPPGYISPQLLSRWGIDWEELGQDDDGNHDIDSKIQDLLRVNRHGEKEGHGVSESNVWSQAYLHPAAIFGSFESMDEE
ncbi:hypothetical protein SK128_006056 [Halocaridina rubra]|uniref:Uncharacterized protein n=1 Tax=Halocaridina rubra TaxID=373956 RepID=A0AAN8X5G5_HALRR